MSKCVYIFMGHSVHFGPNGSRQAFLEPLRASNSGPVSVVNKYPSAAKFRKAYQLHLCHFVHHPVPVGARSKACLCGL